MTLLSKVTHALIASAALAVSASAQRGDRAGEEQPPLPADLEVPPAPVLDPQAALRSLTVPDGFRVELVAAEPLVHDPVCMTFGADGRLWVVEMRSFMPNVDGTDELQPNGRVVVLEDQDRDGVMDRSTVFLDGLVLPRAVGLVDDGALVIEPPNLWFWRDTDGDGAADDQQLVADGFDAGLDNPEHAANGLMHGLDNWIYLANHPLRLRRSGSGWEMSPAFGGGQWGLSMDDLGRLFFNYNSDFLRVDLVPGHYALRHPQQAVAQIGVNHRVIADQAVWPGRVTPGINRGYQRGMLRDGYLTRTTAVCGAVIYRGSLFPDEFRGNAFICEPAGNLIRRAVLTEDGGVITGTNAYQQREFLTSTDERFRPVNLYNGPDGALYVVDMYRGILQHRNFVTSFLRKQIIERKLEEPLGLGRIYRIVPEGHDASQAAPLSELPSGTLVDQLHSPDGWTRDTAQQLLVERNDPATVKPLRRLVRATDQADLARMHALWTLQGMGHLSRYEVFQALDDSAPVLRHTGIRLAEDLLAERSDIILMHRLSDLAATDDLRLRMQLVLTLGELGGGAPLELLADLAARHAEDSRICAAVLSGLFGREHEFLRLIRTAEESSARGALLSELAALALRERDDEALPQFLGAVATSTPWQQRALLRGMVEALPEGDAREGYLVFPEAPVALGVLAQSEEQEVQDLVANLVGAVEIRSEAEVVAADAALSADELRRFSAGARLFGIHCAVCHQRTGTGMDGLAPPLRDSAWVTGPPERPIAIVMHGLSGPIDVGGRTFDMSMPGHLRLDDEQIAAILTYIRRSWGHRASSVDPDTVQTLREATADRQAQWSATELQQLGGR